MLLAESAVLVHFKSVGIVLLVLHGVVVALFAFCTRQCNFNSHFRHLLFSCPFRHYCLPQPRNCGFNGEPCAKKTHKKISPIRGTYIIPQIEGLVNSFLIRFLLFPKLFPTASKTQSRSAFTRPIKVISTKLITTPAAACIAS